jgi:peroxiredoxin
LPWTVPDGNREGETAMPLLNPGDQFPQLTITTIDDQPVTLPDALAGEFAVVLFYRGSWCPYCNAQLRAFERASQALAGNGIRVAALSVDDKDTTAALVAKLKLSFPVGYGADAQAVAALTGAFVNPDPVYLQSTGFVLDPAGNVIVGVYSSGAIGRLVPEDVTGLVRYLREHAPSATATCLSVFPPHCGAPRGARAGTNTSGPRPRRRQCRPVEPSACAISSPSAPSTSRPASPAARRRTSPGSPCAAEPTMHDGRLGRDSAQASASSTRAAAIRAGSPAPG